MTGARSLWGSDDAYAAWVGFLDQWAEGADPDPSGLPRLAVDDMLPATWDRLLSRITDAVGTRMQRWADALTAALSAAGDEFSAGRALAQARPGLRRARALVAHPGLPEEVRDALTGLVDDLARRLQTDLERDLDAAGDRVDPAQLEARRRTLRDNPLTAVLVEPDAPWQQAPTQGARSGSDWAYDPAAPVRRRLFTDQSRTDRRD